MWELDQKRSWAPKNRCFELWCWRRLLRVPWASRRSNQSILKEISPKCSLESLMLKLKLQDFGHLMEELTHLKRSWCLERLKVGGEGDNRGWDGWLASLTQWTWVWVNSGSWWWTGRPDVLQFMGSQRIKHNWAAELNWGLEWATRSSRSPWTATTLWLGTGELNSELTAFLTWLQTPGLKWRIAMLG